MTQFFANSSMTGNQRSLTGDKAAASYGYNLTIRNQDGAPRVLGISITPADAIELAEHILANVERPKAPTVREQYALLKPGTRFHRAGRSHREVIKINEELAYSQFQERVYEVGNEPQWDTERSPIVIISEP